MRRYLAIPLVLLASILATDIAGAAVLPPGNSGATQYAQSLPGAAGNEAETGQGKADPGRGEGRESGGGHGPTEPGAEAVAPETAKELRELGHDGKAALNFASGTSPEREGRQGWQSRSGSAASASESGGSSGVGEILSRVTGTSSSGGMGFLAPVLILLTLLAAAAYGLRRRRDGQSGETGSPRP